MAPIHISTQCSPAPAALWASAPHCTQLLRLSLLARRHLQKKVKGPQSGADITGKTDINTYRTDKNFKAYGEKIFRNQTYGSAVNIYSLAENQSSDPSAHIRQLTTSVSPALRDPMPSSSFWGDLHSSLHIPTQMQSQTYNFLKN